MGVLEPAPVAGVGGLPGGGSGAVPVAGGGGGGRTVRVAHTPIGPACTVETAAGQIIRGYRVRDDYDGPEFTWIGRPVRTEEWDGDTLVFLDGVQQRYASTNGWSFATFEKAARRVVVAVEPPPLLPPLPRRER